mmetsp:Transcript_14953/g.48825  ORF Transcript_14953/g.48825 Transcript_14953/m.48825 type:complete len:338 (-) Transcript_14953:809-1822(-)
MQRDLGVSGFLHATFPREKRRRRGVSIYSVLSSTWVMKSKRFGCSSASQFCRNMGRMSDSIWRERSLSLCSSACGRMSLRAASRASRAAAAWCLVAWSSVRSRATVPSFRHILAVGLGAASMHCLAPPWRRRYPRKAAARRGEKAASSCLSRLSFFFRFFLWVVGVLVVVFCERELGFEVEGRGDEVDEVEDDGREGEAGPCGELGEIRKGRAARPGVAVGPRVRREAAADLFDVGRSGVAAAPDRAGEGLREAGVRSVAQRGVRDLQGLLRREKRHHLDRIRVGEGREGVGRREVHVRLVVTEGLHARESHGLPVARTRQPFFGGFCCRRCFRRRF